MKENNPLVSIIVPSYNKSMFILQTLDSIRLQNYVNWELIIIDDASTDDSVVKIKKWLGENSIKAKIIVNKKNMGIAYARQHPLKFCNGKYVTYLSDDDLWDPNFLTKTVGVIEEFHVDVVYTQYYRINEHNQIIGEFKQQLVGGQANFKVQTIFNVMRDDCHVMWSAALFRKTCFSKCKYWQEIRYGEDLQWLLEGLLIHNFNFQLILQPLASYRIHSKQTTQEKLSEIRFNNKKILGYIEKLAGKTIFDGG